jgi:hypothetical protein
VNDDHELQPGDLIADRYRITTELGRGGFAATYAAHDVQANRLVVVKALSLQHVGDWKSVELFRREADILRALDHRQIPDYVDFIDVQAERSGYLVQTLANGEALSSLLAQGRRFSERECLDVCRQVLSILSYLGQLSPKVVHRDIKPANLILDADGTVRLVDFGAVRELAGNTVSGSTMVGTLGYMAPEQLQGEATVRSDLYGLGMTLVHLLTGREPSALPKSRLKPDYASVTTVEPAFAYVLDKLIEAVPEDRFASAGEALHVLGDTRIVASAARAGSGDAIDALVQARDQKRADERRARQRAKAEHRAKIARRRAASGGEVVLRNEPDGSIVLDHRPSVRARATFERGFGVVAGYTGFAFFSGIVVLGIVQGWNFVVLINIGIWSTLFAIAFLVFGIASTRAIRRDFFSVRVNPRGNFSVYRNEEKPLAFGKTHELELMVWPAGADEEFGGARVSHGEFELRLDRLTDQDVAAFEQFRSSAGLPE